MHPLDESETKSDLGADFAQAMARPERAVEAALPYLRWPEIGAVVESSVSSVWHAIVAPAEESLIALSDEQKMWLLYKAGLLRGANLALIVAWRPSGDTFEELASRYPGFGAVLTSAEHSSSASHTWPAPRGRDDERAAVIEAAAFGRSVVRDGLVRGFGLACLLDVALDARSRDSEVVRGRQNSSTGADHGASLSSSLALTRRAAAISVSESVRQALLEMSQERRRLALPVAAKQHGIGTLLAELSLAESRGHPLSVPERISRFGRDYVAAMLAYLIRWWLSLGLSAAAGAASSAIDASRDRESAGALDSGWIDDLALSWAREEIVDLVPNLADPEELRWRLADLAQSSLASGWLAGIASP